MPQELMVYEETSLLRPELRELAIEAITSHQRARRFAAAAMRNIIRAGQALRKLRDLCDDDEWRAVVAEFDGSERMVQRYMLLAKHWPLLQSVAPPDSLTSQRKAMRVLQTLLYGESAPARLSGPPPAARGASLPPPTRELPAPQLPAPERSAAEYAERKAALERIYLEFHGLLGGLVKDFVWRMAREPLMMEAHSRISEVFHRLAYLGSIWFPELNAEAEEDDGDDD